ncbi:MAG: TetR/AcrR family transcriptional regulator [Reichenbachiella sp.]
MTEKKEKILRTALELFAKEGFKSTSTSKVAKYAGVSEGLIFRHFKNKEGLLEAIIQDGEERIKVLFAEIVLESDPKEVLRKTLRLEAKMTLNKKSRDFWKLQFKIKWELEIDGQHKMEAIQEAISKAFDQLGYKDPVSEASTLLLILEGAATKVFLQKDYDFKSQLSFLTKKYDL